MFDLVAGEASASAVYAMKFSYPNEKKAEVAKAAAQQVAAANTHPAATAVAEKLHFDWKSNGNKGLLPARVFDDGSSVYLAWDKETPLPAILTQNEDKQEGPVNYQLRGEYIVITPVPANLVLRYGKRSAALWPTRQVVPQSRPATPATRVAQQAPAPSPVVISEASPPPPASAATGVKLANMTSLYSDKVTDNGR
jgi:type IV secretion system protein VirB9